ncbi:PLP-dependent transferase [Pseudovirgaria hyperparasitica]|uniref:PLP-dependent transferase n=1 Tax=Pseudovirgaria hyperparasitica TaxID=470096 RepID=A0A6A6W364_9PEZI|nr:PLP-dependent transferase [Pseudovirgaria hyperparasitica]KAF2755481.1 PLP-dependent transferase [Pseudovirgaria hyperparasitica]
MDPHVEEETTASLNSTTHALSTLALHADDILNSTTDVAPALHVSTTFRYPENPDDLVPINGDENPTLANPTHIYSRVSAPTSTRLETILSALLHAPVLAYTSGLAAFHALLVYLHPKTVAISGGYHGCHGVLGIYRKLTGCKVVDLFADDEAWDAAGLGKGDLVHVETPVNPTGEARDLAFFVKRARERGAWVSVDATLGPPGLQEPFGAYGVDVVMHSGTKYIGGHSDLLLGVLAVRRREWVEGLGVERVFLGAVPGSMEAWLGIRGVRTLELRVRRQSESAERLVGWLDGCLRGESQGVKGEDGKGEKEDEEEEAAIVRSCVHSVQHASLQKADMHWLKQQMPGGFGPVFAINMKTAGAARALPSKLTLFHHATSLGGVESLIEWRRMSDEGVDERLLRVSVGIEDWVDLKGDLVRGFRASTV